MEVFNIVICGLGGQGVLFMSRALAGATMLRGYSVITAETHGMAQRGGPVVSHLRIGHAKGSLIRTDCAQLLLAMDEGEAYKNANFLTKKGHIYVNTSSREFPVPEMQTYFSRQGITYRKFPALEVARELRAIKSANLGLLGYCAAYAGEPFFDSEALEQVVDRLSPAQFREVNLGVFRAGLEKGLQEQKGQNTERRRKGIMNNKRVR